LKKVVLKKVMKTNLSQALCQQALREQQIAMELKHFNILQTHSVFETDTEYAVTMEIVSEADYF
jgi:serine/threonine protein kinase